MCIQKVDRGNAELVCALGKGRTWRNSELFHHKKYGYFVWNYCIQIPWNPEQWMSPSNTR